MQLMMKENLYATHETIQPLKFWKFHKHKRSFAAKVEENEIFVVYRMVSTRALIYFVLVKISSKQSSAHNI